MVSVYEYVWGAQCVRGSEGTSVELVLSLHLYVCSGMRLAQQVPLPTVPPPSYKTQTVSTQKEGCTKRFTYDNLVAIFVLHWRESE